MIPNQGPGKGLILVINDNIDFAAENNMRRSEEWISMSV
jgi:hypothetical protein